MRLLGAVERFIYESKRSWLIAAGLLLSFVKTGIWYMPNIDMWRRLAVDPFHNPFPRDPQAQYIVWDWLSPYLAWLLHANGPHTFFYFHLLFSFAFTGAFITLIFRMLDEQRARTSLVVFLAVPASATAYFWVGMDSLTLLLLVLLLAVRRSLWLAGLIGVALGLQHFEQAFCALVALTVALLLSSALHENVEYNWKWGIAGTLGVITGKIVLVGLFWHFGMHLAGRLFYLEQDFQIILNAFYFHFEYILWSALGVGWIAAAKLVDNYRRATPFFVGLFGLMLLLPIVSDETRVISIVTFPLLATYVLLNAETLTLLQGRIAAAIAGLWVLVPWPYVLGGGAKWSAFPYDVTFVLHELFGWFNVPSHDPLWPL